MKPLYLSIPFILACCMLFTADAVEPVVLCEETVAEYTSPNNGAGPLWCFGAPLVVRLGDRVFVNAMETGENARPYCNTRWRLFERTGDGWKAVQIEDKFQQREPCPIAALSDTEPILSTHPETKRRSDRPDEKGAFCDNYLLRFDITNLGAPPELMRPAWPDGVVFYEHSYRGLATHRQTREILLFSAADGIHDQLCLYRDGAGNWKNCGEIHFPVRGCYAQAAVRHGAAHILAVGDIVEPVREWWEYKKEKTGNTWDYVFRRLFYTWSPDLTKESFREAVEIDNVDSTAGHIQNLDLWLGENNTVYLLYTRSPVSSAMLRDRFFPHIKLETSLHFVELCEGKIQRRVMLARGGEGLDDPQPSYGRFHSTPDGRLYAIGSEPGRNWIQEIAPALGERIAIPLKNPFGTFFTATERGGSSPSYQLDMFGNAGKTNTVSYACIQLE